MIECFGLAWRAVCCCVLLLTVSPVAAQPSTSLCGSITNAYGPFDYRNQRNRLAIVEKFHFKPQTEALIRPAGAGHSDLGADLDYTLRASPNHHRALIAMVRYGEREKALQVPGANFTIDCYFDRAIRFAPDDAIVRMLFASYLSRQNKPEQAERELEVASALSGDNPFTLYNIGLSYFEMKRYDKALQFDHQAKALGWLRKDLEDRLRKVGKWVEPHSPATAGGPATAAPGDAAASSASNSMRP